MILPNDKGFRFVGRFKGLGSTEVTMGWSNSMIECVFKGTSLSISLEDPADNYFVYVIDGNPIRKKSDVSEIANDLSDGEHTLQIIKATESGFEGGVVFKGLDVTALGDKPSEKSRKIFVSGASVSQGYGNVGCCKDNPKPLLEDSSCTGGDVQDCCPAGPYYQDAYLIYSAFLARKYDADLQNVGLSGTGITKNGGEVAPSAPGDFCSEDKPATNEDTLPYIYTKLLIEDEPGTFSDWDSYVPDAMFIDAGSNDFTVWDKFGGGSGATRTIAGESGKIGNCSPTEDGFVDTAIKWINQILTNWPNCHVFLIGWINDCANTRCPLFKQVVDTMNNDQVHFFDLSSLDALDPWSDKAGCNLHPLGYSPVGDVSVHEEAANMITDKGFADILGWTGPPVSVGSSTLPVPSSTISSSTVPSSTKSSSSSSSLSTGAVIGIVVGAVVLIALILGFTFGLKKQAKART